MKHSDKKLYENYQLLVESIRNSQIIDLNETDKEKEIRKGKLLEDYRSFVRHYFPHYLPNGKDTTSQFHIDAAEYILNNPHSRLVYQLFRGAGKSTTFTIFIPIWLMLKKEVKYFLVVGNSQEKAEEHLRALRAELQHNPGLIHDYGRFFKSEVVASSDFITSNREIGETKCQALSRGGGVRGLRFKSSRVDLIVADDITDDTIVENPTRAKKMYEWFLKALCKTVPLKEKGRIVVCENKYHKRCLSAQVEANPVFKTIRVNILKEDGTSNWPEYLTIKDIERIRKEDEVTFEREMMNNPIEESKVFKPEHIRFIEPLDLIDYTNIITYCDPSWTSGKRSDFKAIMTVGVTSKKDLHILDIFCRRETVEVMMDYIYKLWIDRFKEYSQYFIESNFMQGELIKHQIENNVELKTIPLNLDKRKKENKMQRIEKIVRYFQNGQIYFSNKVKNWSDTQELKNQLFSFSTEKGAKFHDDGPDALEGCITLLYMNEPPSSNTRFVGGYRREFTF